MSPYETLGLTADCDPDTIKVAFRAKAKRLHPDAGGGAEEFAALQQAYEILGDPERRANFDLTGDLGLTIPDLDREAQDLLCNAYANAMKQAVNLVSTDLVAAARQLLGQSGGNINLQRHLLSQSAIRIRQVRARTIKKGEGPDRIAALLDQMDRDTAAGFAKLDRSAEVHARAYELIEDYSYAVDPDGILPN